MDANLGLSCSLPRWQGKGICEFGDLNFIAKGQFGRVFKAKYLQNGKYYALKAIRIKQRDLYRVKREIKILSELEHKHIVKYFGAWTEPGENYESESDSDSDSINLSAFSSLTVEETDENVKAPHVFIAMELYNMTLKEMINDGLYKKRHLKRNLIQQLVNAVYYLHSQGIVHRDLKPENIFISNENNIIVGDFGVASSYFRDKRNAARCNLLLEKLRAGRHDGDKSNVEKSILEVMESLKNEVEKSVSTITAAVGDVSQPTNNDKSDVYSAPEIVQAARSLSYPGGTPRYNPPELQNDVNEKFKVSYSADIYSLGVIYLEMSLSATRSGLESRSDQKSFQLLESAIKQIRNGKAPHGGKTTTTPVEIGIMQQMLDTNPKMRPTSRELLKHVADKRTFP